jgi:MFS family permease
VSGAALIMPGVVALVASIFARDQRPRAYGLVASAGAIAVAAGPLIGGLFTTYLSWRWVFAGEVLVVLIILWPSSAFPPPGASVCQGTAG